MEKPEDPTQWVPVTAPKNGFGRAPTGTYCVPSVGSKPINSTAVYLRVGAEKADSSGQPAFAALAICGGCSPGFLDQTVSRGERMELGKAINPSAIVVGEHSVVLRVSDRITGEHVGMLRSDWAIRTRNNLRLRASGGRHRYRSRGVSPRLRSGSPTPPGSGLGLSRPDRESCPTRPG